MCLSTICAQTIDTSFKEPLPVRPARIQCLKVLPDGKILLGGDIAYFKSTPVNNLIRLNSDGTLDETFNFTEGNGLLIRKIELQSTGDIIVLAQSFTTFTDVFCLYYWLYRLDPDGTVKNAIDTLLDASSIAVQDDNKVLVCGGDFSNTPFLYRYNSDFSLDTKFNNKITFNNQVYDVKFDNNKLFVSGYFSTVNDT
jgi:hypothetical protein